MGLGKEGGKEDEEEWFKKKKRKKEKTKVNGIEKQTFWKISLLELDWLELKGWQMVELKRGIEE